MAKNRYINTHFWDDTYILDKDPTEKLLFLYALTNPLTSISGCYEISLKRIAFDTGIDQDMVVKILDRFKKDGKMLYVDGWLCIKNFIKHQKMNPNIMKGIETEINKFPESVFKAFQSLSKPLNYININYNSNINNNEEKESAVAQVDGGNIRSFFKELNPSYYHTGKEAKAIKQIIERYNDWKTLVASVKKFQKLTKTKDKFWKNQPLTPYGFLSLVDRIEVYKFDEVKVIKPERLKKIGEENEKSI